MTDWLRLAADICLSPYSAFAPQGASQAGDAGSSPAPATEVAGWRKGNSPAEIQVSGRSSPTISMTHPPLSSRSREREGSSMEESLPAEMVRYDLAPEHKGEIATRESLESEGAAAIASNGNCGFFRGVQNGLTARRDEQQIQTPAGIPTFDEEYGRTYRGRLFTGNTIEELFGAVVRVERGAGE